MDAQAQAYPADQPSLPEVLATAGDLTVRLARTPDEIAAAQALRYEVFYQEMAAAPTPEMAAVGRDFDRFDDICDILLVVDGARPPAQAVVGTYRMLRQEVAWAHDGFYSADEYDLTPLSRRFSESERGLELGRSCVHLDYRSNATIQLLWRAIAEYMATYNIAWMFGCASLPGTEPDALAEPLSFLHHHCLAPADLRVRAVPDRYVAMDRMPAEDISPRKALAALPPLIKGYLRLGAHIGDGAVIDPQFGTTDVCIILPVRRIGARYFSHFRPAGEDGAKAQPPAAALLERFPLTRNLHRPTPPPGHSTTVSYGWPGGGVGRCRTNENALDLPAIVHRRARRRPMTVASATPARPAAVHGRRLGVIDAARGAAVGLMVIYHLCWDLSYFGFAQFDLLTNPWWLAFRTLILGSFLAIAGFVQVLAHGNGFRPMSFLRRFGLLVASAAAITLASWWTFPDSYIFFGVLHCLALASLLTLGAQRLPVPLILVAAAFCIVAPALFAQPLLDHPWLYWLGLVTEVPVSNDYVPILPWFGVTLLGVAAGKFVVVDLDSRLPAVTWRPRRAAERTICWSGRHSLLVYLVHQPVLLGLVYAATLVVDLERPGPLAAGKAAFSRDCYAGCAPRSEAANPPLDCHAYCACIGDGLTVADLWPQVLKNELTAIQEGRIAGLVAQCMRKQLPAGAGPIRS